MELDFNHLIDKLNLLKIKQEKDQIEGNNNLLLNKLLEKQNITKEIIKFQEVEEKKRDIINNSQNKMQSKRLFIDTDSVKRLTAHTHNLSTKHDSHYKCSSNIDACTSRRSMLSPCSKSTRATDDELTSRRSMNLYNMIMAQKKKSSLLNSKINETKIVETCVEASKDKKLDTKKFPSKINKIKTIYDSKSFLKSNINSPLVSPLRGFVSPKKIIMSTHLTPTDRSAVSSNIKNRINKK